MKAYNYLPYPINEYLMSVPQPGDTFLMSLARKDQAAWNYMALESLNLLDSYHRLGSEPDQFMDDVLSESYRRVGNDLDGEMVRDKILSTKPEDFLVWFNLHNGLWVVEGKGPIKPKPNFQEMEDCEELRRWVKAYAELEKADAEYEECLIAVRADMTDHAKLLMLTLTEVTLP